MRQHHSEIITFMIGIEDCYKDSIKFPEELDKAMKTVLEDAKSLCMNFHYWDSLTDEERETIKFQMDAIRYYNSDECGEIRNESFGTPESSDYDCEVWCEFCDEPLDGHYPEWVYCPYCGRKIREGIM